MKAPIESRKTFKRKSREKDSPGARAPAANHGFLTGINKLVRGLLAGSLILIAAVNLSGCFWVAAGGAGAVGYKVGTDERSVGTQFDDATITSKINAKLVAEPGIRSLSIDVDTLEGNVTLSGYVKSEKQLQRVVEISRRVEGVKSVTSNLKIGGE